MNVKKFLTLAGVLGSSFYFPYSISAETIVNHEIVSGIQQRDVNSPESKFEEYGEIPNGLFIDHYGLSAWGERVDIEFNADHVRLDNQSADFLVQGSKYCVEGSWDQSPHLFSKESRTLFNDSGNGTITLSDQIQRDLQTAYGGSNTALFISSFSDLASGARTLELKTQTDQGRVGFNFDFSDALKLNMSASETMKKGYQAMGTRIDADYSEFARPVDFKTYDSNLGLGYAGKDVQWGFDYNFSSFKNEFESVLVDNPIRFTNDASNSSTGRMSLEPDNYAHHLNFNGGVSMPAHSRLTAQVAYNYMRQNQDLLPYTSNPTYPESTVASLPTDKANAKVLNWIQDYNLTSRPWKPIDFGLHYHMDQFHNVTENIEFPAYFETESEDAGGPITNENYSFKKDLLEGKAGWQVADPVRFNVKYGVEWIDRDDREIDKSHEDSLKLSLDLRTLRSVLIRGSYNNAHRRMKEFSPDHLYSPNVRLVDVTDRDRDQGHLLIQINTNKTSVALTGGLGHDKYRPGNDDLTNGNPGVVNQMFGVLDSRTARAGVDVNCSVSEWADFSTYYEYQQDKTNQRGSRGLTNVNNNFNQEFNTRYDVAGVGINLNAIKSLLDIKLGYDITRSHQNTDFFDVGSAVGTVVNQPETATTQQNFSLEGKARMKPNLIFGLGYIFQKYDVYDWATDNLGLIAPAARNIFLGDATHDYKAHIVQASVDYKF